MPDIRIRRDHALGLARARQIALQWAEQARVKLDLECAVRTGNTGDTIEFKRAGVNGELVVAGDRLEIEARLGWLLAAFSKRIESEIEKNLDDLLARGGAGPAPHEPAAKSKPRNAARK